MYHRVLNEGDVSRQTIRNGIIVKTETFKKQIGFIRRHLKPVSLKEFAGYLEKKIPFPNKTCLITFDDGWRDNFLNAYPALRENHMPAVIFLSTDFIGTQRFFWQEELTELLASIRSRFSEDKELMETQRILDIEGILRIIASDPRDLPKEIDTFLNNQKKKNIAQIRELIHSLKLTCKADVTSEKKEPVFLNWDEVKTMADDGIAFGSHGKSHALLPALNAKEAEEEIRESREILEKNLKGTIDAFSYPNGNFDTSVLKAVQDQGYRVAFGTERGYVSKDDHPFSIRRINIHQDMTDSTPMLMARIAGLW